VLVFLSLGVIFDIIAVTLMVMGTTGTSFTTHGIFGYAAFLIMFVDTIVIWRFYFKKGLDARPNYKLVRFTKYAYMFWVIAYFTGSLIVLWR
jgi:hypothetical protein